MLSQNNNALGIIFPNSYDNTVPELVAERTMASIPFAGRYRMVDFMLSSMANCGISNVSIVVRKNYHSLMDHLGTGREWDMARRHGGLNIVPPFAEKGVRIYSGRVEALGSILSYLENQKEKYVVMSDANIALMNHTFASASASYVLSQAVLRWAMPLRRHFLFIELGGTLAANDADNRAWSQRLSVGVEL